jgi:hypothetical protein
LKRLKEVKGWKWEKIEESFPGRTMSSCKNRYKNRYKNIHEGEKRATSVSWAEEEDKQLKRLKEVKGWSLEKIQKSFLRRTLRSCQNSYHKIKGTLPPSNGAARASRRDSNASSSDDKDDDSFSSNTEDEDDVDEEVVAASEASPIALPHDDETALPLYAAADDDDVLPPVISSSFSAVELTYYPSSLPPRKKRHKYSTSSASRDEKMINRFRLWHLLSLALSSADYATLRAHCVLRRVRPSS